MIFFFCLSSLFAASFVSVSNEGEPTIATIVDAGDGKFVLPITLSATVTAADSCMAAMMDKDDAVYGEKACTIVDGQTTEYTAEFTYTEVLSQATEVTKFRVSHKIGAAEAKLATKSVPTYPSTTRIESTSLTAISGSSYTASFSISGSGTDPKLYIGAVAAPIECTGTGPYLCTVTTASLPLDKPTRAVFVVTESAEPKRTNIFTVLPEMPTYYGMIGGPDMYRVRLSSVPTEAKKVAPISAAGVIGTPIDIPTDSNSEDIDLPKPESEDVSLNVILLNTANCPVCTMGVLLTPNPTFTFEIVDSPAEPTEGGPQIKISVPAGKTIPETRYVGFMDGWNEPARFSEGAAAGGATEVLADLSVLKVSKGNDLYILLTKDKTAPVYLLSFPIKVTGVGEYLLEKSAPAALASNAAGDVTVTASVQTVGPMLVYPNYCYIYKNSTTLVDGDYYPFESAFSSKTLKCVLPAAKLSSTDVMMVTILHETWSGTGEIPDHMGALQVSGPSEEPKVDSAISHVASLVLLLASLFFALF